MWQKIFYLTLLLLVNWGKIVSANPKIISLSPASTEIIFSLGLGKNIVGISNFDNYPPEVKNIPQLGDVYTINLEMICQLRPKIIFSAPTNVLRQQQNFFKKQSIETVVIDPKNITDIISSINIISEKVSRWQTSPAKEQTEYNRKKLMKNIFWRMKQLQQNRRKLKNVPKIFILLSDQPYFTIGKNSFLNEAIELAGGKNIFADVEQSYFSVNPEEIIKRQPDIILVLIPNYSQQKIKKLGAKFIIDNINPDILARPTLRLFDGIELLQKKLVGYEQK